MKQTGGGSVCNEAPGHHAGYHLKSEEHLSEGCIFLAALALETPAEAMERCCPESGSRPNQKPGSNKRSAFAVMCP